MALTMQESRLRSRLVGQLHLVPGLSVLGGRLRDRVALDPHLPSGTGARVFGVDPDVQALRIAGRKSSAARTRIRFDLGDAERLPVPR